MIRKQVQRKKCNVRERRSEDWRPWKLDLSRSSADLLDRDRSLTNGIRQEPPINRCLFLALWAVVAAGGGAHAAFDGSLADQAGLGFTSVDAMLELEESFFAVGIDIIGNGGTAEGDGFAENFLH